MDETLGQYQLIERIAAGGMGEVFLARLNRGGGFEKVVAVKRMLPALGRDARFVELFHNEARLAAQLNHANVVHVYDFGQQDETAFIAMEFVHGENLRRVLQRLSETGRRMPLPLALKIAADACRGLGHAHAFTDYRGRRIEIIHHDVSPSNLLISFAGEVKVADFGLARAASGLAPDGIEGKYGYMSPEQARGEPLDGRSDLFSLGAVLFEMAAGRALYPLDPADPERTLRLAREGRFDLSELLPTTQARFEAGLCRLLQRLLSPDRERRHPDARTLLAEIEDLHGRLGDWQPPPPDLAGLMGELFPDRSARTALLPERTQVAVEPIQAPTSPATPATPVRRTARRLAVAALLAATAVLGLMLIGREPATATLDVAADPPDAVVAIDGVEAGRQAPVIREGLVPGKPHQVTVSRDLHRPFETQVVLAPGERRRLMPVLDRLTGRIDVDSDPPGASISLDSRPTGRTTPASIDGIPLGRETVVGLALDRYLPWESRVKTERPVTGVRSRLVPADPRLSIDCPDLPRQELLIDWDRQPGCPRDLPVETGRGYRLMLLAPGFHPANVTFEPVRAEQTVELRPRRFKPLLLLGLPSDGSVSAGSLRISGRKAVVSLPAEEGQGTLIVVQLDGGVQIRFRTSLANDFSLKPPRSTAHLMMNVDSTPWTNVTFNGTPLGVVPQANIRLDPDRHRFSFRSEGQSATMEVTCEFRLD